jgi:hypothetical protein
VPELCIFAQLSAGRISESEFSNPEAFMILEVLTIYLLVQCASALSQLIRRRRDVFYYVSKAGQPF